ncbi:MAG: hypothetical protein WC852_00875 [Candidatus Nanoarchaeia archaeon]
MKLINLIFVLLAVLILMTACEQSSGSNEDNPWGDSSPDSTPDSGDSSEPSADSGTASGADSESALRDALGELGDSQNKGEGDGAGSAEAQKKVNDAAAELVEWTINDPTALPQRILDVLEIVQKLGLEKSYEKQLMDKLKEHYKKEVINHVYCKREWLDLLSKCQALGFADLADYSNEHAKRAPWCDSKVERIYSYKSTAFGTTMDFKITAQGMLKQYTLFGFENPDVRTFYFTMGALNWDYAEEVKETCLITRKISSGSENLSSMNDGSFEISNDGSYWGSIIHKQVKFKVEKIKVPPPPPNPGEEPYDPCEGIQSEIYEEDGSIEIPIEGKTDNPKKFSGSYSPKADPFDEDTEHLAEISDVTTWDININYLVDEMKKIAMGE